MENQGTGSTSSTSTSGTEAAGSAAAGGHQSIDPDYVKDIEKQRVSWKTRAQEHEAELARLREELALVKGEVTKVKESHTAELEKVRGEHRQEKIRSQVLAEAQANGLIDKDLISLFDISKVSIDNDGKYKGIDTLITEMKGVKPHLFGEVSNKTGTSHNPPPPGAMKSKSATEMTDAEYAQFKQSILAAARR